MEVRLSPGRVGIRIRAFGMTARPCSSELASASDFLEATGGAGIIGGPTGITTTQFTTTGGITRQAGRFITGTTTIEAETRAANLAATTADLAATRAEIVSAAMKGTGPPVRTPE